jgi:hypothetical protein
VGDSAGADGREGLLKAHVDHEIDARAHAWQEALAA